MHAISTTAASRLIFPEIIFSFSDFPTSILPRLLKFEELKYQSGSYFAFEAVVKKKRKNSSSLSYHLTSPFKILDTQNQEHGKFYVVQKRHEIL